MPEDKKTETQEIVPDLKELESEVVRGHHSFPSNNQYITPEQVRAIDKQALIDSHKLLHYLLQMPFEEYCELKKDPIQKEVLDAGARVQWSVDALIAVYKEDLFLVEVDQKNTKKETGIRYTGGDQPLQKQDFYGGDPLNTLLMDEEQREAARDYLLITESGDYFSPNAKPFEIATIRSRIESFAEVMAAHPELGEKRGYSAEKVQAICDALQEALPALPLTDKVIDTEGTVIVEGRPELPPQKINENER